MNKYEKVVICDLDGTLVDDNEAIKEATKKIVGKELNREKVRKLDREIKKLIYDTAQKMIEKFKPKNKVINFVNELKEKGFFVVILTARYDRMKKYTEELLKRININYDLLLMRKENDEIDDEIWKKEVIKSFIGKENIYLEDKPENLFFIFESFSSIRKNGEVGKFYLIVKEHIFELKE